MPDDPNRVGKPRRDINGNLPLSPRPLPNNPQPSDPLPGSPPPSFGGAQQHGQPSGRL